MSEERKVNFSINEGEPFFSHELSINFNPTQFIFDFKCVTPRVDARSSDGTTILSLKHNVVMVDPYHAKQIVKVLAEMLEKYEKRFGEIRLPKALQVLETEAKKSKKASEKNKQKDIGEAGEVPNYLG